MIRLVTAKPRPKKNAPASKKRKNDLNIKRATAWVVIFGIATLSAIPAIISLSQPAASINEGFISERALCGRRCAAKNNLCLHQAGVYQPSIDRCEITHEVCRQVCLPPEPPNSEPMTLRRCADLRCKPQQNNCLNSIKNGEQNLDCEKIIIKCLSECRLAVKTGMPLPIGPFPESSVFVPEEGVPTEQTALETIQNQLVNFSYQLDPIKRVAKALMSESTNIPEDLAKALTEADDLIMEVMAVESYEDLQDMDITQAMQGIADRINKHQTTLEQLIQLKVTYNKIEEDISSHERLLADDKIMLEQSLLDLSREIADYDRLLDIARSSLVDAKQQITDGDAEKGLDILITEVLDNMTEMSAIHQSIIWTLSPEAGLMEITNKIGYGERLLGRLRMNNRDVSAAEALLSEIVEKQEDMYQKVGDQPFDESAFFILGKELSSRMESPKKN